MRINKLCAVSEKERTYKITDFRKATKNYLGVNLSKDGVCPTLGNIPLTTKKVVDNFVDFCTIDGKPYALTDWGAICGIVDGEVRSLFVSYAPEAFLTSIERNGKSCLFAICPDGRCTGYDGTDVFEIKIPVYSKITAMLGNTFYLAIENRLIFESVNDMEKMNDGKNPFGNYIDMPNSAGEIVSLIPMGKRLLIFCNTAVYELSPSGSGMDFQIVKKATLPVKLMQNTTAKIGDKVAFCAGGKIFTYDGGNLSEHETIKNLSNFPVSGRCAAFNEKFVMPIIVNGKNRAFYYDFSDESEGDFLLGDRAFVSDGGFYMDDDAIIRVLSEREKSEENGEWESKTLDFNTHLRKAVKGVMLDAEGRVKTFVSCEYGGQYIDFDSGCDYKKLYLSSRSFGIKLSGNGFGVNNLRLIYEIKGE